MLAVIAAGVAFRFALVWSGVCDRAVVCDDAYYGFNIARNIARGLGSTFDGRFPTNGYHPLYVWMSVPFYWACPNNVWLPIHGVLSVYAVLDGITACLIWRGLKRLAMPTAAWVAGAVWMALPLVWLTTLRGCEASVVACIVAALLCLETRPARGRGRYVAAGVLSGLAFLARTDMAILLAIYHPYHLWRRSKQDAAAAGTTVPAAFRRELRRFVPWTVGIALLVALPWFGWNWARFGTIMQTSGQAKRRLYSSVGALPRPWQEDQSIGDVSLNPYRLMQRTVALTVGEEFVPGQWVSHAATLVILIVTVAGVGAYVREARVDRGGKYARFIACFGWAPVWLFVYVGTYAFWMYYYYSWYAAVPMLVWTLWLAAAAEWAAEKRGRRRCAWQMAAALLVLSAAQAVVYFSHMPASRPDEEERLMPWFAAVNRLADDETVVGSWNSGAYGYFAGFHSRGVWVNLDGVVNNRVLEAAARGEYGQWLLSTVHLIVERPRWASAFFADKQAFAQVFSGFEVACRKPFVAVNRRLMPDWRRRLGRPVPSRLAPSPKE